MKKHSVKQIFETIVQITAMVLFVTLIVLTFTMIVVFSRSSMATDNVPFDLDMLTSSKKTEISEINGYLLPEIIGISIDGEKLGISASANIVSELYTMISPTLSEIISVENFRKVNRDAWNDYTSSSELVYVRYYNEMPDNLIGLFADAATHGKNREYSKDRNHILAYVYELVLLPADSRGMTRVAVRNLNGEVALYESSSAAIDYVKISEVAVSYKSSLARFVFSGTLYQAALDTEPVFIDSISTRDIMLSADTGIFVMHNEKNKEAVMRLFSVNPDKLLSEHEDPSGSLSYTDVHGMLYIRMRGLEYQATSDGGVDISEYIGYTTKIGLEEYIRAAVEIISSIRSVNKFLIGNDADPMLYSVEASDGRVRLTFEYAVDNVLITGKTPALVAEFEDGKLRYMNLNAVAAKILISKSNSYTESWFFRTLRNVAVPRNVSLVYEGDYKSNSVSAKWAASVPSGD